MVISRVDADQSLLDPQDVKANHKEWLAKNKHIKYLWLPYTDAVVVVKNNPVPQVHCLLSPR